MTVQQAVRDGRLVILPTETSARSFLTAYIKRSPFKAVFRDSVISWDTFKKLCTAVPEGLEEARPAHRLLFSYTYLSSLKRDSHFYNIKYPETLRQSARELASALPYLKKALESPLASEAGEIMCAYNAYLSEHSLYESGYLEPDYTSLDDRKPLVLFADNIPDPGIETALSCGLQSFTPEAEKTVLLKYPNTLFEIKDTMRKIRALLDSGVKASDIAVTSARLEETESFLKSESSAYSVKLAFVRAKSLTDWDSGSFFKKIAFLKSNDFDLQSVRSFLLNPVYPFRDREMCSRVIERAVECKIISGLKTWLYKTKDDETGPFVLKFTDYVNGICLSQDAPSLRRALKGFQDDFFLPDAWTETQGKVFRLCMDTLDELESLPSLPKGLSFYEFFLSLLSSSAYAPGKGEDGIKVFKYPVSCPLDIKHHFVISLDDESSRQYRSSLPFTDDPDEKNLAESICASLCREGTVLSYAEHTYSSYAIAPSYFEQHSLVREAEIKSDIFAEEKEMWFNVNSKPSSKCLPSQKEAFDRASLTVFPFSERKEERKKAPCAEGKVRISATSLSAFENCPFAYKCQFIDKIEDISFETDEEDALSTGNIIHDTYEKYFRKVKNISDLKDPENKNLLRSIFYAELEGYSKRPEGPSSVQIERIRVRYQNLLEKIGEVRDFQDFSESDMEYQIDFEEDDYYVSGRIDCIMRTADGKYAVIDFKKREGDTSSPQLILYAEGLKKDRKGKYSDYPVYASFYGVETQTNRKAWENPQEMEIEIKAFSERAEAAVSGIKRSDFSPTPGKDNCTGCSYRRVCRMRYVIK